MDAALRFKQGRKRNRDGRDPRACARHRRQVSTYTSGNEARGLHFLPPPLFLHPQPTTFFLRLSFTRTGGETFSSDGKKSVRYYQQRLLKETRTVLMLISSTSFWLSLVQKDPARTCSSWSSSCSGSNDHSRRTRCLRRSSVPFSSSEVLVTRPSVRATP